MRPSCKFPRGVASPSTAGAAALRLVLKFVAFYSAWPLGQGEYRTGVREILRLRKEVYGRRGGARAIGWGSGVPPGRCEIQRRVTRQWNWRAIIRGPSGTFGI